MKVLIFAASLRKGSLNKKLAGQAVQILKAKGGLEIDHADFREFEMPMYDGDLEDSSGIPAGGQKLVSRMRAVDAIVISTPEYNGGMPGTLKNAVDWVSRSKPIAFKDKPLLLLGASPGGFGAVRSLWHTRVPFEAEGALVHPTMFGLAKAHEAFDANGTFIDAKNTERLKDTLSNFLTFASKFSAR